MKKIVSIIMILGLSAVFAADGKSLTSKCTACHGTNFEKAALGKSAIVKGQKEEQILASLKGYKSGTQNKNGMGALMKSQMSNIKEKDIKIIAKYISKIK